MRKAMAERLARFGLHGVEQLSIGVIDEPAVDIEEDQCGVEGRSLVTVEEGLVLGDMKGVSGSHVKKVSVKKDTVEGRGGNGDCGLKGTDVACPC